MFVIIGENARIGKNRNGHMKKQYWLFKSEPTTYSIDHLKKEGQTEWWGIRNYQVRNMLRDQVAPGDGVLFYHSNAKVIGIAGTAVVASKGYPDTEQFRKGSDYYDPKSRPEKPQWYSCDVKFQKKFSRVITLDELRQDKKLAGLLILRPGSRLSVTPVTEKDFQRILSLAAAIKK